MIELKIIERELQRLDDKSTLEGLTASDCKSLEVLVKVRALIISNEKLFSSEPPKPSVNIGNAELRKLLSETED